MRLQRRHGTEFVLSLFFNPGLLAGLNWLISVLNHLVNHPNTKIKNQTLNRHNLSVLGRLYSLILSGYPFKCTSDGFILFVSV